MVISQANRSKQPAMIRPLITLILLFLAGNSLAANQWYATNQEAHQACFSAGTPYNCDSFGYWTDAERCSGNQVYGYFLRPGSNGFMYCQQGFTSCPSAGQIRNLDGNCVCPSGQSLINGVCSAPEKDCPASGTTTTETRLTAFVSTSGELFYNHSRTPTARQTAPDSTNFWCNVTVGEPTNCRLEAVTSHSSAIVNEYPDSVGKKGAIKVCDYTLTHSGGKGTSSATGETNAAPVNSPTTPTNTTAESSKEVKPTVKTTNGPVETTVDETIEKSGSGVEIIGSSSVKASDGTETTTTVTKTTTTNADGSKDVHYDTVKTVRKNPVVRQDYDGPTDTYNPRVTPGELTRNNDWRQQHFNPDGSPGQETSGGGVTRTPLNPPPSVTNGGSGGSSGNDTQPGDDKTPDSYSLGNYNKGSLSDDGGDSRLTTAKSAYGAKLAAIKTEAKGVLDFNLSGGTAVLPNIHIADIKGVSIDSNLNQWSDSLSIIGNVLVFLAYITGLFMVLGVKGGGN